MSQTGQHGLVVPGMCEGCMCVWGLSAPETKAQGEARVYLSKRQAHSRCTFSSCGKHSCYAREMKQASGAEP